MNISDLLTGPTPKVSPMAAPHPVATTTTTPTHHLHQHHNRTSISAAVTPSPVASAAKLQTPPLSNKMSPKRRWKRGDPKPVWAVMEREAPLELPAQQQQQAQDQGAPPPPQVLQQQYPPGHAPGPGGPPQSNHFYQNGGPPPQGPVPPPHILPRRELQGYERPITNDAKVYDEISRKVCDFLWANVVDNGMVRQACIESPGTQVEIEAKWGQIHDRHGGGRLKGLHVTECVVDEAYLGETMFKSTMSLGQHRKMNGFLNTLCQASNTPGADRARITYKHTKESDSSFFLDQEGLARLSPTTRQLVERDGRARVRITREEKSGEVIDQIVKLRLCNLEISSPQTEWDYRISVNLEIKFPGPTSHLKPVNEPERAKDRVSYSWLEGFYRIDLTQVTSGEGNKNHELELEVDAGRLIEAAERISRGEGTDDFEEMVAGMVNNLRVLSRELTNPVVPVPQQLQPGRS